MEEIEDSKGSKYVKEKGGEGNLQQVPETQEWSEQSPPGSPRKPPEEEKKP